jgi:hypothetical protein
LSGIKISALPAAAATQLTDLIPAVQAGVTVRETITNVITLFNANVQLASAAQVTGLNATLATFVPLSGGTMSGPLILSGPPTVALQAATKAYVDTVAAGFTVILAAQAATTANLNATQAGAGVGATLTNNGAMVAFAVDGYSASLNDRILVKNQTATKNNGVYVVTTVGSGAANWVLTRATDYDQNTEIKPGTLVAVNNGTVNANTSWLETATVVTVDTDPVLFSQFTFAPSSFLMVANNLSDVANAATSRTNLGLGTVATKAASDASKANAVMLNAASTIGNIAIFTDVNGTIGNGGLPSNASLNDIADGRLTLTTGTPVTTADVLAASTIFYTPYIGNNIALFDGVATWNTITFVELSIAVPGTASTMYDVFVFNNAGTATLELATWTNDTTRATGLVRQNGVLVKSGATTRRYVGSFRTTAVVGQTEDSLAKRYVWNYYNRVLRTMKAVESTASWTYSTATFRQANGSASNQLDMIIGKAEDNVFATVNARWANSTGTFRTATTGIALDATNVNNATSYFIYANANVTPVPQVAWYNAVIAEGRHFLAWVEKGAGVDTQTWQGNNGGLSQEGIIGYLRG